MVKPSSLSKFSKFSILSVSSNVDNAAMVEQEELIDYAATIAGNEDAFSDQDYNDIEGGESSGYGDEPSEHDHGLLPASPVNISGNLNTSSHRNGSGLTMRESLLAEAWNRRKELALQDDLANLKEHAMPNLLGRSSSDCGAAASVRKHHLLNRSVSDVGNHSSPSILASTRTRTRSLTDDDFEELKGFMDLGFHFNEASLPAFSNTLPALEVYCAVAQSLQESPYCPSPAAASPAGFCGSAPSTPQWKVCSPGDSSEVVKGRLRHWAQAVACNVRLCY